MKCDIIFKELNQHIEEIERANQVLVLDEAKMRGLSKVAELENLIGESDEPYWKSRFVSML